MTLNERVAKVKGWVKDRQGFWYYSIEDASRRRGHIPGVPDWSGNLIASFDLAEELGRDFQGVRRSFDGWVVDGSDSPVIWPTPAIAIAEYYCERKGDTHDAE